MNIINTTPAMITVMNTLRGIIDTLPLTIECLHHIDRSDILDTARRELTLNMGTMLHLASGTMSYHEYALKMAALTVADSQMPKLVKRPSIYSNTFGCDIATFSNIDSTTIYLDSQYNPYIDTYVLSLPHFEEHTPQSLTYINNSNNGIRIIGISQLRAVIILMCNGKTMPFTYINNIDSIIIEPLYDITSFDRVMMAGYLDIVYKFISNLNTFKASEVDYSRIENNYSMNRYGQYGVTPHDRLSHMRKDINGNKVIHVSGSRVNGGSIAASIAAVMQR